MPAATEPVKVYWASGTAYMSPTSWVLVVRDGKTRKVEVRQLRADEVVVGVPRGQPQPTITPYSASNPMPTGMIGPGVGAEAGDTRPPVGVGPAEPGAPPAPVSQVEQGAASPSNPLNQPDRTPPPADDGRGPGAPLVPSSPPDPAQLAAAQNGTNPQTTTTPAAPGANDVTDPGPDQLVGIPEGAQLWRIDGRVYVAYTAPGTNPPVPILWHVEDIEDLADLTGGRQVPFARDLSQQQAAAAGAVVVGTRTSDDLVSGNTPTGRDLYEDLIDSFAQLAAVNPAMLDPQILAITTQAALEGRDASDPEVTARIQQTDWWRNHSASEREWMTLAMSDPATATQRSETNRVLVRDLLVQAGYPSPPQALVNYLSNRYTDGRWTEAQLRDEIRRETDPYAPGASPFAGRYLPEGAEAVTWNGRTYIQYDGKLYEMTGQGQAARYAEGAREVRQPPKGRHVVDERGRHYFEAGDGKLYVATGPGQVAGLERLYGEAQQLEPLPPGSIDMAATRRNGRLTLTVAEREVAGDVVGLFGGPGGIETFVTGEPEVAGDVGQILTEQQDRALGEEERVRALLMTWLGPYYAQRYDSEWIAREAGALRNGGAGAEERLVGKLRDLRVQFLPGWSPDQTYDDIAAYGRGQWERFAGIRADEVDPLFLKLLDKDMDAQETEQLLRHEGNRRGWAPVVSAATQGLTAQVGSQVRRSAV